MTLANTPADIIRHLLVALELATHPDVTADGAWPCFVSILPNDPGDALAVFDTAPMPDGRVMRGTRLTHPGIQVRVRAEDYTTAWQKVSAIGSAFDMIRRRDVQCGDNTYRLDNVSVRSGPLALGEDENERHEFTLNAILTLQSIPASE